MKATGHGGTLKHAYHMAATLGDWSMEWLPRPPIRHISVVATILDKDEFRLQQDPLDLVLTVGEGRREWCWEKPTINIVGDTLHASVKGKPKGRPGPHATRQSEDG